MAKKDDIEFHGIVRNEIESAVNYHDTELSADRIETMDYYLGEPFGNELDGRSAVVSSDVADTVEAMLPSLMKIFTASGDFVRFAPRGPEDVEAAAQATDYVNFILNSDNNGFVILHNFLKDALLFKYGVVKSYYDETETVTEDSYIGLTEDELTVLLADPDIEVVEQEMESMGEDQVLPDGTVLPAPMTFDVRVKKTERDGRVRVENIPPEEFLFNRRAKSMDDCRFAAHRTRLPASDLIAMGYDRELVESNAGFGEVDDERENRFEDLESGEEDSTLDPSQQSVLYTETYIKTDYDDDGIAELRRVCCIGAGYEIVKNEPYGMMPFSVVSPILMPHRMVGRSVAELVKDLQEIKSSLLRQQLDNVYLTNNARIAAVEGQVNIDDLMSNRPGGVVRMRAPGMVQPITPPAINQMAFPLLQYMDQVKENRTGMTKASQGLDPDSLQSSTRAAVAATISASQQKIEMIARVFAETGIKHLMQSILRLVQTYQQGSRIVRLRNKFVPMDPQEWATEFDTIIEVGIGTGDTDKRIAVLTQVAQKQEEILTKLGVANPLCTLSQYRDTLARIIELSGFKDSSAFLLDPDNLPPELQQKIQARHAEQKSPQDEVIELERAKVQAEIESDRMKMQAEIEMKREKVAAEMQLKREEMQIKMELRAQEMQMEAQLRGLEASTGIDISTNLPRA
jgi:hypothetical protein